MLSKHHQACIKWPLNGTCWMAFSSCLSKCPSWVIPGSILFFFHLSLNNSALTLRTWSCGLFPCIANNMQPQSHSKLLLHLLPGTMHVIQCSWDASTLMPTHLFALCVQNSFSKVEFSIYSSFLWRPASNASGKASFLSQSHSPWELILPSTLYSRPIVYKLTVPLTKWHNDL